jgi:hypothetical protein
MWEAKDNGRGTTIPDSLGSQTSQTPSQGCWGRSRCTGKKYHSPGTGQVGPISSPRWVPGSHNLTICLSSGTQSPGWQPPEPDAAPFPHQALLPPLPPLAILPYAHSSAPRRELWQPGHWRKVAVHTEAKALNFSNPALHWSGGGRLNCVIQVLGGNLLNPTLLPPIIMSPIIFPN